MRRQRPAHPAAALGLAIAALAGGSAVAQTESSADRPESGRAPFYRLTVNGTRPAELAGGAATYLSAEDLERFGHTDVHRALRQVPGLYTVEEDGFGLRPNIGLRGSGTDRNARITVMEDGVPIAPAPYSAPAAYYFPTMQRVSAVEVRKGSAAVRSGPRTTGGAINLISTPIPDGPLGGRVSIQAGDGNTLLTHVALGGTGGTNGQLGYLVEGVRQHTDGFKELDGGGGTGYTLGDYRVKLRYSSPSEARFAQTVELKLGVTDHHGDETFVGLTLDDFARTPFRRYAASRLDNIRTDHDQIELRHYVAFGQHVDLTTAVYHNEFARNWYKLDRFATAALAAVLENPAAHPLEYAWLTGGDTSPNNALILRNNKRNHESRGMQTVVGIGSFRSGAVAHDLEIGLRLHEDFEHRMQDDDRYRMQSGTLELTADGAPGSQDNRLGQAEAVSLYVHDELSFGKFILTPGVRYEHVDLEQRRWPANDPARAGGVVSVVRSGVDELIGGVGSVYRLSGPWTLLAGIHQGFNPPAPGTAAAAEESLNYEAGARFARGAARAELIAFHNDYDNLVGTCTSAMGGGCTLGDQFSAGKVRMQGLEATAQYRAKLAGSLSVPLELGYTYTSAEFRSSFASGFEQWGNVAVGDELPYLPEHQARLMMALLAERWELNVAARYTDAMRVSAGQGPIVSELEETDSYWVVDLAADVSLNDNLRLFARIENVLDDTRIVAWRPAGARPGRQRTTLLGITASF